MSSNTTGNYYAQPYNPDAVGFYFDTEDEYTERTEDLTDRFGSPVAEFEIQFIEGDKEDAELFKALGINQASLSLWFDEIECKDEQEKAALFYLVSQVGYSVQDALQKIDEVCLFKGELLEAATESFDELYAHTIPENIRFYIDYEAFARDCRLGGDMAEFEFAGTTYTVTNASGL